MYMYKLKLSASSVQAQSVIICICPLTLWSVLQFKSYVLQKMFFVGEKIKYRLKAIFTFCNAIRIRFGLSRFKTPYKFTLSGTLAYTQNWSYM